MGHTDHIVHTVVLLVHMAIFSLPVATVVR
jgi:hypothetical protein